MAAEGLDIVIRDRVAYVTINRPERMNTLTNQLHRSLISAFDSFSFDDDVWVVQLTGAGDEAFSAGRDLAESAAWRGGSERPTQPMAGVERNLYETVLECSKPVIAIVNGWAIGGGCELALAADLRMASATARLGLPEAKRGLGATFGAQMLARTVPLGIAYEMLFYGEPVTAELAARWGLVNWVVPAAELRERAEQMTRRLLESAPLTVRRYKAAIQRGRDLPLPAALRLGVGPNPYLSQDRIEGTVAFKEKRKPVWKGE